MIGHGFLGLGLGQLDSLAHGSHSSVFPPLPGGVAAVGNNIYTIRPMISVGLSRRTTTLHADRPGARQAGRGRTPLCIGLGEIGCNLL